MQQRTKHSLAFVMTAVLWAVSCLGCFVFGYYLGLEQGYAGYFYIEEEDTQIMPLRP